VVTKEQRSAGAVQVGMAGLGAFLGVLLPIPDSDPRPASRSTGGRMIYLAQAADTLAQAGGEATSWPMVAMVLAVSVLAPLAAAFALLVRAKAKQLDAMADAIKTHAPEAVAKIRDHKGLDLATTKRLEK
jgi:hypothetical protein